MPNKNLRLTPKISLKERYMLFRQAAGEIPPRSQRLRSVYSYKPFIICLALGRAKW